MERLDTRRLRTSPGVRRHDLNPSLAPLAAARTDIRDPRARLLAVAAWLLPFALVVYLGLRGGGYDSIVRDQVAFALWLAILVCCLAGILPAVRLTRAAWIALGLLAGFLAWSALGALWSDSVERTLDLVPMLGAYLAVFALVLMTTGRDVFARSLSAVAAAIGVLAAIALLSRYVPEWFPADETRTLLPEVASRLKYPLDSWNGLAGFIAMGIPLLLAVACDARSAAARVLGAAAVPVAALAIAYTASRGGTATALAGAAIFIALRPRRLEAAPTVLVTALGSGVALVIADRYQALKDLTPGAADQEGPMLAWTIAVCAAVGVAMVGVLAAERAGRLPRPEVPALVTRRLGWIAAIATVVAVAGIVATGTASDAWRSFKSPEATETSSARLLSAGGNLRYQQWDLAVQALDTSFVGGRGGGTYEYWWARETETPGYTRFAHSLYFETLAETGIVGAILVFGFIGFVIWSVARLTRRAPPDRRRGWLAGAAGCAVAFALVMGIDWAWHVSVVPVAFLLVAGGALGYGAIPLARSDRGLPSVPRVATCLVALALAAFTVISWLGAQRVADSRQAVNEGDLDAALEDARDAASLEPWAATPHLQQALVLEEKGEFTAAAHEAALAVEKEPFNWEHRWTLSRIEEAGGNKDQATFNFYAARELNRLAPYFTRDQDASALTPLE